MRAGIKNGFNFFIAVLAGIFLLTAIGAKHHFAQKRLLIAKDGSVEISVISDAEKDGDGEKSLDLGIIQETFSLSDRISDQQSIPVSSTRHARKHLTEERLYILFHHLRAHIS